METRFSHRVGRGRCCLHGLLGPHRADIDDGATLASRDHFASYMLGYEERAFIQLHVSIVVFFRVLQKSFGEENSGAVSQQIHVGELVIDFCQKKVQGRRVGDVVLFVITFPNEPNSNSAARSFWLFLPTIITASAPRSSRILLTVFPIPLDPPMIRPVWPRISEACSPRPFHHSDSMEISLPHWPGVLLKMSSITRESTSPDWL